jgi:hypothetical protein
MAIAHPTLVERQGIPVHISRKRHCHSFHPYDHLGKLQVCPALRTPKISGFFCLKRWRWHWWPALPSPKLYKT